VPPKRFDQARPFLTLILVVIGWLVVPVVVKTFTRASFFEFQAPVSVAASYIRDLQEYWSLRLHSNNDLISAGKDLAGVASNYEIAAQTNTELQAEIARLEDLLKLPPYANYRSEYARVVRRDFSGWWQRLVIRKGKNYGIPVGAPVIFSGGVVGRVSEVHAYTAVVELISNPGVRLAGVIEGETQPISFQGGINATFDPPKGVIEFVPLSVFASTTMPKRLVTSGLGGVFPPGLSIGEITSLDLSPDGLFKSGEVTLDERIGSLTEVTVLVPLNPEEL
jgi:rod shape-determining protein MreC